MKTVAIKGQVRAGVGKKSTKADRVEKRIPCVLYGGEDTVHFTTTTRDVKSLVYTAEFKTVEIDVDGTTYNAILKDMQFHPVTEEILHMDFLRLIPGHPIKVRVPLLIVNIDDCPGIRGGGSLVKELRKLEIKATPENLIDHIDVSVAGLQMGQGVKVRDLDIPEGVEVMSDTGIPVLNIIIPRALKSAMAKESAE